MEDARGRVVEVVAGTRPFPGAGVDVGRGWEPRPGRWPAQVEPDYADDGLVAVVPDAFDVDYDAPFFRDYHWVAMLNPVELADGVRSGGAPVELRDMRVVEHHGRRARQATAESTPGYQPRCDCCALLAGQFDYEEQIWVPGLPSVVRLDEQTGVCVGIAGAGPERLDVEILAVDQLLEDALFR